METDNVNNEEMHVEETKKLDMLKTKIEKVRIGMQHSIAKEMIDAVVDIDQLVDDLGRYITFEIRGYVWGEKESLRHYEIHYPLNWKEALKERWFPKWAITKWPIKYKDIEIDVKALYPELKIAMPDEKHSFILSVHKGIDEFNKRGEIQNARQATYG